MLVVTFAIGVFAFPPFDWASAWVFGGMAAAMCPLGQVLATAMLPTAESRAPSLRRVDSLLLVGPLWAWALWGSPRVTHPATISVLPHHLHRGHHACR